jgi:electron transport complex protein RnfG
VSPARLIAVLGGTGALAGALILLTFDATSPAIEAHRARRLHAAITEVLKGPSRYDTLYVVDGALQPAPPGGREATSAERVYLGRDAEGRPTGYAVISSAAGFQDQIQLIFGYDAASGTLLGFKVLDNKETPGLGDKIEKDSAFVTQFAGLTPPLTGVKPGAGKGGVSEVDLITGATISSRAVIKIINDALARLGPALAAGVAAQP